MPVFEYRCRACGRQFSALIGMTSEPDDDACPRCGAKSAERLVSRFSRSRTEDDRVDEMADRMELFGEPESPSDVRTLVREMGKAMDEDLSDEMEEVFEADQQGTLPDED